MRRGKERTRRGEGRKGQGEEGKERKERRGEEGKDKERCIEGETVEGKRGMEKREEVKRYNGGLISSVSLFIGLKHPPYHTLSTPPPPPSLSTHWDSASTPPLLTMWSVHIAGMEGRYSCTHTTSFINSSVARGTRSP